MERDLKNKLNDLKLNYSTYEINEYFANDFADDYDFFAKDENNIEALEFLNDEFIDIDTDYRGTDNFEAKVFETIDKALKLIK